MVTKKRSTGPAAGSSLKKTKSTSTTETPKQGEKEEVRIEVVAEEEEEEEQKEEKPTSSVSASEGPPQQQGITQGKKRGPKPKPKKQQQQQQEEIIVEEPKESTMEEEASSAAAAAAVASAPSAASQRRASDSQALTHVSIPLPIASQHYAWNLTADLLKTTCCVPETMEEGLKEGEKGEKKKVGQGEIEPGTSVATPSSSQSQQAPAIKTRKFSGLATTTNPVAILILNNLLAKDALLAVWDQASIKICADGGANVLYDFFKGKNIASKYIPDLIVGDLDSVRPDVIEFYKNLGSKIFKDADQSTTDFEKALGYLTHLESTQQMPSNHSVLAIGGLDGRFDHTMQSVYCTLKEKGKRRIYLVNDQSIVFTLQPGKHVLHVNTSIEGPYFGLFPILGDAMVTTRGFKWDIEGQTLSMSKFISSSNRLKDLEGDASKQQHRTIEITTSGPLLYTCSSNFNAALPSNIAPTIRS